MKYRHLGDVAACIGCGCHDLRACAGGCYWLRVDYDARAGVCSQCVLSLVAWAAGERSSPSRVAGRGGSATGVVGSAPDGQGRPDGC